MSEKILYVDDDANLLAACQRSLARHFDMVLAQGPQEGLRLLQEKGPFAVILSDMRMPGMDGVAFLVAAREQSPNSICMMLTGNADLDTAAKAVNQGQIFRFLSKPCTQEIIATALRAGIRQHQLVVAEHELLQKTLMGSIQVLAEILGMVNPSAFSRAMRVRGYVRHFTAMLKLPQQWQYEIAAMLSQIGCVTLPPNVTEKMAADLPLTDAEALMVKAHPGTALKLLEKIPRMETIAKMIAGQCDRYDPAAPIDLSTPEGTANLGSQILHLALDLDTLVTRELPREFVFQELRQRPNEYQPKLLHVLATLPLQESAQTAKLIRRKLFISELRVGMFTCGNVLASNGALVVPKRQEITEAMIARLRNFADGVGVQQPIEVLAEAGGNTPDSNTPTGGVPQTPEAGK